MRFRCLQRIQLGLAFKGLLVAVSDPNFHVRIKHRSGELSERLRIRQLLPNGNVVLPRTKMSESEKAIEELQVFFADTMVRVIERPDIFEHGTDCLEVSERQKADAVDLAGPFEIREDSYAMANIAHPYAINANACLRFVELSLEKFVAQCTPEVLHQLIGHTTEVTSIHLPVVGAVDARLKITSSFLRNGKQYCTGQFLDLDTEALQTLFQFLIRSAAKLEDVEVYIKSNKETRKLKRELGAAIKIEFVENQRQYDQVLKIRFEAYRAAGRHLVYSSWKEMSDEFDDSAFILLAKLGEIAVGTLRGSRCEEGSQFPFERSVPLPVQFQNSRSDYFELAKLAVLPRYQKTDVVIRLMQEMTARVMCNKVGAFCTATPSNAGMYLRSGALKVSEEHPHPINSDETFGLYVYETELFRKGNNMTPATWSSFGSGAVNFVSKWTEGISLPVKDTKPKDDPQSSARDPSILSF